MNLQATARGFLVILALSIHDLFEGVALGVARRESSVWFLLLAFASHKWVIAGCLGLAWARSAVCCCLPSLVPSNSVSVIVKTSDSYAVHDCVLCSVSYRCGGRYGSHRSFSGIYLTLALNYTYLLRRESLPPPPS